MPITPPPVPVLKKSERTSATILQAARELFAERGHSATTIRDIAAGAGVDPALVMRYFGSKDELFVRAAAFELSLPALKQVDRSKVGETLLRHFLNVWEGPEANNAMAVLLRSAASNEMSAGKLRELFSAQVLPAIGKVASRATAGKRAGLVATQLLGLALCRYILKIPPVAAMSMEELVRHVAPTLQRYVMGSE